jgi:ATP-binding cassette subfamily C protein LapB
MTEHHTPPALATPPAPNATTEPIDTPTGADMQAAAVLSRLAALLGHAVPVHRFGMLTHTTGGADMANLSRQQRATEMWLARFPGAAAEVRSLPGLAPGDLPLLWVSTDGDRLLLVRGRLANGSLTGEDHSGAPCQLGTAEASEGQLLWLRVAQTEVHADGNDEPLTATEWFAFAIRKHRRIFLEGVFATFIISSIGLMTSLYTMQVYDRVVPTKGFATLWVLTAGVLMAIALEFMMKQVRAYITDRASKAIDLELSAVFFGKALDIRMDARPATVGTFASQIRHFESVRQFMTSSTLFILADAPFALLFIGVIALIAGKVALVPLLMVPLAVLVGLMFRKPIERLTAANMAESNRKNGLLIEAIDGIESVKAAAGEWKMLDRYRQLSASMADSELQLRTLSSRGTNLTQSIQQLSYVGLVAAGAYAISAGELTMGGLIACSIISGRALAPLAQLPQLIIQWKHAQIALKALDGIMAMPSDRDPGQRLVVPETCTGHVQLDKVAFLHQPQRPTLQVPALTIKPGERIAVVGAVGSGKTTLIKLLSGLYRPSSGNSFLDGVDMAHLAPEFVREHIGYLPQDVRLFNGSLRENLTLGLPTPSDAVILAAARLTGLDQIIQAHPKGLELDISEGGRGLSGGQRQLVGLTRMLIAQPRVLLLDEPTASMDAQLEARVMRHLFQEVSPSSVLVVVTHKLAILPHVNRIIVVDKGQIALDGPRDDVIARLRQLQNGIDPTVARSAARNARQTAPTQTPSDAGATPQQIPV